MSEKTVAQKLLIKPGYKVLFLQASEDYAAWLGEVAYVCQNLGPGGDSDHLSERRLVGAQVEDCEVI